MNANARRLADLDGIGKAALKDFHLLGIQSVQQLCNKKPEILFEQLKRLSGPQDICVLDVLRCAIEQAKNPRLPKEQRQWWYWSKKRKGLSGK